MYDVQGVVTVPLVADAARVGVVPERPDLDVAGSAYRDFPGGWPQDKETLTYSWGDAFLPEDPREPYVAYPIPAEAHPIVRAAMDAWEEVSGVRFVEVVDSPQADLRIGLAGLGVETGVLGLWLPFDVLGVPFSADAPVVWASGAVLFNADQVWTREAADLTALHELGHAMGLAHSGVVGAVMAGPEGGAPYPVPAEFDGTLHADDIAGAQALWGLPDMAPVQVLSSELVPQAGWPVEFGTSDSDSLEGTAVLEALWGGFGDDTLVGGGGGEVLGDVLGGGPGDDLVVGGPGGDVLTGGTGDDTLEAGGVGPAGANWLNGEAGDDRLVAGDGQDLFVFDAFEAGGDGRATPGVGAARALGDDTIVGFDAVEDLLLFDLPGVASVDDLTVDGHVVRHAFGTVTVLDGANVPVALTTADLWVEGVDYLLV